MAVANMIMSPETCIDCTIVQYSTVLHLVKYRALVVALGSVSLIDFYFHEFDPNAVLIYVFDHILENLRGTFSLVLDD